LSEEFSDKFGFTQIEVEIMADYLGLNNHLPEIKEWYNGCVFGKFP
jgi:hypothetical protein